MLFEKALGGRGFARLFRINVDCDGCERGRNNLHKIRKCWLKITPKHR